MRLIITASHSLKLKGLGTLKKLGAGEFSNSQEFHKIITFGECQTVEEEEDKHKNDRLEEDKLITMIDHLRTWLMKKRGCS